VSGRLSPTELVTHSSFSVRYSEIDIHLNTSTSNRCSILLLPSPIPSSTFTHVVLVAAEQLALLSGPPTSSSYGSSYFSTGRLTSHSSPSSISSHYYGDGGSSRSATPVVGTPRQWHHWTRPVPFPSSDELIIEDTSRSGDNIFVRPCRSAALPTSSPYPAHSLSAPTRTPTLTKVNRLSARKRANAMGT
jgi:hypothetical protein